MPTGIANAIIYVRGIDLLSKPIQRAAAEANASLKKLYRDQESNSAKMIANSQKIASLTRSVAKEEQNAALQAKLYATQKSGLKNHQKDLYDQSVILQKIRQEYIQAGKTSGIAWDKNEAAIAKTNRALGLTQKQITDVKNKAQQLKTFSGIDIGVKKEQIAELNSANASLSTMQQKLIKVELAAAKTKASIANFQAGIANLQSKLSTFGLTLSAVATAPIVGAFTSATKSFADYESSLRNIQSIGRQTDSEMSSLSSTFLNMSKDITKTIATPKQLAESFYEVQSAGFYGADAMNILDASTRAATAGLADQQEVAKALAMALHAYGVGTEEATHYTDVMMKAVDIGIFRFEDLTSQMGDFIAAAGMMGVPIEEVMAALTAMTKKGIPIAEAATSLNRIMMNYLKPAKKEIDLAKEYGIELSANTLKVKGFAGAMTEMLEKTKGNEDVLANLIGEVRGIRGVFALGSDGLKMYNADLEKMYGAAGTVTDVFNTQMRSLSAQFQNLKNNVLVLAIQFGNVLMPIISKFIQDTLIPLIQRIGELPEGTKLTIAKFAGLIAIAGPLMIALSGVLGFVNLLIGALAKLGAGKAIALVADSFTKLGGILKLSTPITTAILGIVASIIAFTVGSKMFSENSNNMVSKIEELSNKQGLLGGIGESIKSVFIILKEQSDIYATTNAFNRVSEDVDAFGESIKKSFEKVNEGYRLIDKSDVIGWLIKRLGHAAAGVNYLGVMFKLMASLAVQSLGTLAEPIMRIIQLLGDLLKMAVLSGRGFAEAIKGVFTGKVDTGFINQLEAEAEATVARIQSNWSQMGSSFGDVAKIDDFWKEFEAGAESAKITMNNTKAEIDALDLATPIRESIQPLLDLNAEVGKTGDRMRAEYPKLTRDIADAGVEATKTAESVSKIGEDGKETVEQFKQAFDTAISDIKTQASKPIDFEIDFKLNFLDPGEFINPFTGNVEQSIVDSVKGVEDGILRTNKAFKDAGASANQFFTPFRERATYPSLQRDLDVPTKEESDPYKPLVTSGENAASKIEDAFATAAGKIQGYFSKGIDFSKGLGELVPGGKEGMMAPGANGAFENLYRIQDIAMSKTRGKGADTDKWAAMYGLTPEAASEIIKKFQMGIFDADVMKYVDTEALINTAKLEMMAEQSQKALSEKLAKQSGLSTDVFMGLFGLNQKDEKGQIVLPSIDLTAIRTQIASDAKNLPIDTSIMRDTLGAKKEVMDSVVDESVQLFLGQFPTAKEKNISKLQENGALLWDEIGIGVVERAKSDGRLYDAVYEMVAKALLQG